MTTSHYIDVAFQITGTLLPCDHGYALYSAISRLLPSVHGPNEIAIHPIRGRMIGNREMQILDSSRLVIRMAAERISRFSAPGNTRPDYQQLLTHVELLVWLNSGNELSEVRLEDRVRQALKDPSSVHRFGGLSLGESTRLVDEASDFARVSTRHSGRIGHVFLLAPRGRLTLPVWVDHVGSRGTRYATGNLVSLKLVAPNPGQLPSITPSETAN
jgi:CRISPR-associated protein Cas5/DevS